ncbi:MAG: NADH-quinone oxidoreductase subunit M [Verrucomicrobiota bacterium]|nr:NADH-quinone oxidoreductase subunit M [Limisphaera sp.]MDW8381319.1 NADH-quinone oxidoreductase subunit M [Verrucomicrobiota bacterium]
MHSFPWLTLLILMPLLSGLGVMLWGAGRSRWTRRIAQGVCGLSGWTILALTKEVDLRSGSLQAVERHAWIPSLGVEYYLGLDGLGWVLLLLTVVVASMALGAAGEVGERPHLFDGLVLCLMAGLFGTFTAQNFVHWFLFWELSLIPAFFLVRLWGGHRRRVVSLQFFLFTLAGSIAMLLGFLIQYAGTGQMNFPELAQLAQQGRLWPQVAEVWKGWGWTEREVALGVLLAVLAGFAVKVPMMPLHAWLPSTYAEASTPVSMLLTGVMSKMGVYGLVRIFLPLFQEPLRWVWPWLAGLALWTVIASACAALAQRDLKRILAYSSVNHLGYCLLAVFALGAAGPVSGSIVHQAAALNGVILQMFNHGLTAATLFWCVGWLEKGNGGFRELDQFGGLRAAVPIFCGLMGMATFASLGLPGLNGFIGEFLIFLGVFGLAPWAAWLALPGLLVTAVFLLTMVQRVFYGPMKTTGQRWMDVDWRERTGLGAAVIVMVLLGLWPQLLLQFTHPFVMHLLAGLRL